MDEKTDTVVIAIRLPEEMRDRFKRVAHRRGLGVSTWLRMLGTDAAKADEAAPVAPEAV